MNIATRKPAEILQNTGLTLLAIFFALAMAEGYLRTVVSYCPLVLMPTYLFENHPRTGWTLRPNFRGVMNIPDGPVSYRINSQGIRAPHDYRRSSSRSPRRIFVVGDSMPFGTNVNEQRTFVSLLNERMQSRRWPVEFVNLGVPGYGTVHSYQRLRQYSALLGVPSVVVYMFCPNDPVDNLAGKREVVNGIRIDSHRKHKVLLSYIARAYNESRLIAFVLDSYYARFDNPRRLKRQELSRQAVEVVNREDFIVTAKYLSQMIQLAGKNDVRFLLVTTARSEFSEPLRKTLRDLPMMEADDIFADLNRGGGPTRLRFDSVHWNEHGHELIAEALDRFLVERGWLGVASPVAWQEASR